ncbi:MAG: DNA adenine methylase [Verrucomicrobia bacterium]|nr:DNA adenine methylase [Verrucomicrobiota bacterium]MCF7707861.1 DNA adenine methylase [Verrucomicrobiota bacterium]
MSFHVPSVEIQAELFADFKSPTTTRKMLDPASYTGLAGFHKYWGKKPTESVSYLVENLTDEGDVVMDPFLGSGLVAIECLSRNRKFVGIDINPFSIELTSFFLSLPRPQDYYNALKKIENEIAEEINNTYRIHDGRVASHYLWEDGQIASIWLKPENGRTRLEIEPTQDDTDTFSRYQSYEPRNFRNLTFFTNPRINVKPTMSLRDIFTGRALMNIDRIIDSAKSFPPPLKRALLLTLTSASGQMSNMVFAIKNRGGKGKHNGNDTRIEVGSWVIGYWIPKTHFEINVWNCFTNRANKLLKALPNIQPSFRFTTEFDKNGSAFSNDAILLNNDCRLELQNLPDKSISFICTDPPHSDRVPYLELSEMWNSILGHNSDFENEIVVSNAKERGKSKSVYNQDMTEFFQQTIRVLKDEGYIALFFNARDEESWEYLKCIEKTYTALKFMGCFPMIYSATSVVQDNRKGAMKSDYVLIYRKNGTGSSRPFPVGITTIKGWSNQFPEKNRSDREKVV